MSQKLLKSTATVSAMTLVSRVMGLARDMVFANVFRVGIGTDAFFVAFKIPNFLRRLFAEGAFSQAFVPVLAETRSQQSETEVKDLADHVAGTLGGILIGVTVVGILAAPLLVLIIGGGFLRTPGAYDQTVDMLRITFPYILFISLTAMAGAVLNTYSRFGVPAFTPVLLNLSLIAAAIWLAPQMEEPVEALAWGVLIAGIAQLAFQLPFLRAIRMLPRPRWGWRHSGVQRITKLMLPAIFGSSVMQINLIFDTLIASFLITGSVSWLYYSDRLMEFPLGVFGIALATVILPSLSRRHAEASAERFSATLDWALRWVLLLGVPASIGLLVLAAPILTTLFFHGEFTEHDVYMSTLSLMAYALGVLGFILVKVLVPGFYARQDTRTPMRIGLVAMFANMGLNVIIVFPLVMLDYEAPHAGLAIATTLSSYVNAMLLLRGLRREGVYTPIAGWWGLLVRVGLATLGMGFVLYWLAGDITTWFQWHWQERIGHLALVILAGAISYFLLLALLGVRWREFLMKPSAN